MGKGELEEKGYRPKYGLHFCRYYQNLVKFTPSLCAKCPNNGLKDR